MQTTLILAAIFNITGGLTILFLQQFIAPPIHFNDVGPGLFRMFVGGTAVLFGAAYIAVSRDYRQNRPLLVYGTVLKYWAFDRHRGGGHPPTPATPPCVRVRTRRFELVTLAPLDQGRESERFEVSIGEPHREGLTPGEVPRATAAAGCVTSQLRTNP